jgi:methanogenic corrinoid protein MtbC1
MGRTEHTVNALRKTSLNGKVWILIGLTGGAPVAQQYAVIIGAAGYDSDAFGPVDKAKELRN